MGSSERLVVMSCDRSIQIWLRKRAKDLKTDTVVDNLRQRQFEERVPRKVLIKVNGKTSDFNLLSLVSSV